MNQSVMSLAKEPIETRMTIPEIVKQSSLALPTVPVLNILFFLFAHMGEIIQVGVTIEQAVIDLITKYRAAHPE